MSGMLTRVLKYLKVFVSSCTGARWVEFAAQENITGARNVNTITGRCFKKSIRCNQQCTVMLEHGEVMLSVFISII